MTRSSFTRRDFLHRTATLALGTSALTRFHHAVADASPIPFSSRTDTPSFNVPGNACDSHMHIHDSRFPAAPGAKYADVAPLAQALISAAPEQVIRGSDWPHVEPSSIAQSRGHRHGHAHTAKKQKFAFISESDTGCIACFETPASIWAAYSHTRTA